MANESKPGHKGKVTLGANTILGMGTWSWSGFANQMLDDTEFGTEFDTYVNGVTNCGKITFNGNFKKDDTSGQDALRAYMLGEAEVTSLRLYVDADSYYTPNNTTAAGGGGLPAEVPIAHVKIESIETNLDKGSLGTISFTAQLCKGPLRLI